MMLTLKLFRVYSKHLGKQIIPRNLSLTSTHCGAQQNRNQNIDEHKADAITQRKKLTEQEIQKIINLDNIHLETKFRKRSAEREPLVRNFFVGNVDKELLAYPQVIDIDDYLKLVETLQPVHSYFAEKSRKPFDPESRDISEELISEFARMHIFGRNVPQKWSGLGYFNSEGNLASECESVDVKFAQIVAGHRLAVEAIAAHGTQAQKDKFLLQLSKGSAVSIMHSTWSSSCNCNSLQVI